MVVFVFARKENLLVFSIFSFSKNFLQYQGIKSKKYFIDHQIAKKIQLLVAIKGNFSGLFFFSTSRSEGELPRDYLINGVTCLFAYH